MRKLIELHKRSLSWLQEKSGLSDYALLWLATGKGIVLGAVLGSLL